MSTVYETCLCGAEWVGPGIYKTEREAFREAHAACRILAGPQAAIDALPEEEQERYRAAMQSIVDARRAGEAAAHYIVLGGSAASTGEEG